MIAVDLAPTARGHRDRAYLRAKLARIDEPHVRPVNDLVREIRAAVGTEAVPFADPAGAGVHAMVLFLLEAPGPKAAHGSAMLSPDNDDPTAANVWRLYAESGVRRDRCISWNAVPWYIGDDTGIRAAKRADVQDGLVWLGRLIELLPDLGLVIAMGAPARNAFAHFLLTEGAPLLPWLAVPHPSRVSINRDPARWTLLQRAFAIARTFGSSPLSDPDNAPRLERTDESF